jgi:hypothetical protein
MWAIVILSGLGFFSPPMTFPTEEVCRVNAHALLRIKHIDVYCVPRGEGINPTFKVS